MVEDYKGRRVGDVKKSFASDCVKAGLEGVTAHTLRHTAITRAMQRGAGIHDATSYFGASRDTLESVYLHHHPDHQESAARAMEGR